VVVVVVVVVVVEVEGRKLTWLPLEELSTIFAFSEPPLLLRLPPPILPLPQPLLPERDSNYCAWVP